MNLRREMRTDRRLWLAFGAAAFVAHGFVSPWNEAVATKVGPGHFWGILLSPPVAWEWWRYPLAVTGYAATLLLPAAAIGWAAQAVVVAMRNAPPPN